MTEHDTLAVRELTVVPEGDEFVVGDPASSTYVVLPAVGVRVLELLRSGRSVGEVADEVGADVDVVDFAQSLLELDFARIADGELAEVRRPTQHVPRWLQLCFSHAAWTAYATCALAAIALLAIDPRLFPRSSDIFFLDTPGRSLAALTVIIYALAAAHEGCHWLAARAAGVSGRVTVSRRLYFLVLQIDLTNLWSLPRRRRYGPLLAGMAFDTVLLCSFLLARYGDAAGWWGFGDAAARALAALTFVQVAALMSQFWIFVRTDVYALLVTATGCVDLFRVNQLLMRRTLRLITPEQRAELAEAHERDVAVARWYRWIYAAGLTAAAWFFVAYFAPATIRLLTWIAGSVAHAGFGSEHFWEALVVGTLILSPRALTLAVALRDLRRWRERRQPREPRTSLSSASAR